MDTPNGFEFDKNPDIVDVSRAFYDFARELNRVLPDNSDKKYVFDQLRVIKRWAFICKVRNHVAVDSELPE